MPAEIIIVDDDPMVGNLSLDLITEVGFSALLVGDSRMALGSIREQKPRLVVMDILMPGLDGLSLLHTLKHDPETASIKVAVVSGKSFKAEIERAMSYGADVFIQKPYDVREFARKIVELAGAPSGEGKKSKTMLQLGVWGGREPDSTPCLSLEGLGRLFILDAGRGLRALGEGILKEGRHKEAWLLLTHFHDDHVSGFGSFPCLKEADFSLHVVGPGDPAKNLAASLREAADRFTVEDTRPPAARLQLHEVKEESYELAEGLRLWPFFANHPSTTLGYLLEIGGKRVVYCPDAELYGETASALQDYDEKTGRICRGADLLIHDARYTDEDHAAHLNEGHSSVSTAAGFAADNEVRRLLLFHADPAYGEEQADAMTVRAREVLDERGAVIPCDRAKEGLRLEI